MGLFQSTYEHSPQTFQHYIINTQKHTNTASNKHAENLEVDVTQINLSFEVTVTSLEAAHGIRQWRGSTQKLQVFKTILEHRMWSQLVASEITP